jgi:CYTH domain-containing protein
VVESPAPKEIERKFLLKTAPLSLPVHSEAFEIEQTYLLHQGEGVARVRRRSSHGNSVYTHTSKRPLGAGQREEIERQITGLEYLGYLEQADPGRQSIRKQRTCFLWEQQYFELDLFRSPAEGMALLELELDHIDQPIQLPPFLKIEREVTEDPAFLNSELARRDP